MNSELIGSGTTVVTQTVRRRRSIREGYHERLVAPDTIREIVACGTMAPSAKNSQPWRLHVVEDRSGRARLADLMRESERLVDYVPHDPRTGRPHAYRSTVEGSAAILEAASFAVLVENVAPFSGGPDVMCAAERGALRSALFGYGEEWFGIGASVQNMWLAALSFGLQGAFLADVTIAEEAWRDLLGIENQLVGALALGYSDIEATVRCDEPFSPNLERIVWH